MDGNRSFDASRIAVQSLFAVVWVYLEVCLMLPYFVFAPKIKCLTWGPILDTDSKTD